MSANGISTTGTKEERQIAKLNLAAANRQADSNARFVYDITQLPNLYNDNGIDPDENPNTGGLVQGRPWVELAVGLYRRTYTGYHNDDPSWFATATQTAAVADSTLAVAATPETTSLQWLGYFVPATTETYTFYTSSDDGSYLWIGANAVSGFTTGNALIDNGGEHGSIEVSGTISLTAGLRYAIRIQTGNNGGPGSHSTSFSTPTIAKTSTFTNRIFYNPIVNGI
jgi:GLEYA domain